MKLIASVFIFMLNIILTADCKAARLPKLSINDSPVALVHKSLELLFKAIEKMLLFYKREYKNMIIDGVYGLRVLEGVSNLILQENQKGELRIPILKKKRILKLGITSSKIAHKTYPYLRKFDSNYFDIMGFTIFEPWTNIGTLKSLDKNHSDLTESKMEELEMNEEKQDSCFNSLTGNPKKDIKPCTISDECWKTNSAPGQKSYYLTHQLLYILLGQVKGCSKVFEERFQMDSYKGGIERFLSQSCHAMYPEMLKQEKKAIQKKDLGEIDLYMEQAVVCGMVGYQDFFSIGRLHTILSWRHPDGCFGFTDQIGGNEVNEEEVLNSNDEEEKRTMRKLKVSRDLKGGCEVHSSGVGLGLMALYLRWLIHVAFSQSPRHKFHQQYLKHNQFHGSDNLMFFFVVVAATMTFLMILSKKFGLRFHRIKIIRIICPFI